MWLCGFLQADLQVVQVGEFDIKPTGAAFAVGVSI